MSEQEAPTTFEAAMARLDQIVAQMEGGDVGLEEAVTLFEEGQRHLAFCQDRLGAVETRIAELTADGDDAPDGGEAADADGSG